MDGPFRPDPNRHPKLHELSCFGIERARAMTRLPELLISRVCLMESLGEPFKRDWWRLAGKGAQLESYLVRIVACRGCSTGQLHGFSATVHVTMSVK